MVDISPDVLWSAVLTIAIAACGWIIKAMYAEQQRLQVLLNRTREEMAKEYITKIDSTAVLNQIVARFDRIEEKIDRLVEAKR